MDQISRVRWRKSSHSSVSGEQCVEVAHLGPGQVGVRDSKAPAAGALTLSRAAWRRLTEDVRAEHYNV